MAKKRTASDFYDDIKIENPDERRIYTEAFKKSDGKHLGGKDRDARKAIHDYRAGLSKAVDGGVKDGSIPDRVASRMKKIDEASGF